MTRDPKRGRVARLAGWVAVVVVVLASLIAVGAPVILRGPRFGRLVERMLPAFRGQIHVGGGRWAWGAMLALLREQEATLFLDDVRIVDPEGTEVLYAERLSGRLQVHRAPARVVVHDLRVENGRWRFARMARRAKVGFLAALEPAAGTAGGAGRAGRAPAARTAFDFEIESAQLDRVDVALEFPAWRLLLRHTRGNGGLRYRAGAFTFDVTGVDVPGGGQLHVPSVGSLPFTRARLDRVATTTDAPDAIRLVASDVATGRSILALSGVFEGIYGLSAASKAPGLDIQARVERAADVVNAVVAGRAPVTAGGDQASLALRLTGAFASVTVGADARGFDVESRWLAARDVAFDLAAHPSLRSFRLSDLSFAAPEGGRVRGAVTWGASDIAGELAFTSFGTAALLPMPLRPFLGGTLDGVIRGRVDPRAGNVVLERSTLVLARAPGGKGSAALSLLAGPPEKGRRSRGGPTVRLSGITFAAGFLRLPRVQLSLWGGRFAATGQIAIWDVDRKTWLSQPVVDLAVSARDLDIQRLAGVGFVKGQVSFRARARGAPHDLAIDLAVDKRDGLSVLGERFRLPPRFALRLTETGLAIASLDLVGPRESQITAAGRIAYAGRVALDIGVRGFPIDRLPGLDRTALPISGLVSGTLRLAGGTEAPQVSGQLALAPVTFQGRPVGGGQITIVPQPGGGIRARGTLIDAIAVDGFLSPKATGLHGEATLTFRDLRLDPFLPALPGGLAAAGVLSGAVVARIAPGRPAGAEGRLSALELIVTEAGRRGVPPRAIRLHSEGEIHLAAASGDGPISLGPARFRGDAGTFELWGESSGERVRGTLRGRIELRPFAPVATRWFDRIQGAVDVNIAAARVGSAGPFDVRGTVSIAAPLAFRLASAPFEARVSSGRLDLKGDAVETAGLPVTVSARGFPVADVKQLDARVRLIARVDDAIARPHVNATIAVDSLDLLIPAIGSKRVHASAGTIQAGGRADHVDITRVDLPLEGEAEHLVVPMTIVDKAKFAVRLRGAPRGGFRLSGDIDLIAVRTSTRAGGKGATPPKAVTQRPEMDAMSLDLRLRSRGGAVRVDVPRLPDLRVDVDMRVGGTLGHPTVTGEPRGANIYSAVVLALRRLFQ